MSKRNNKNITDHYDAIGTVAIGMLEYAENENGTLQWSDAGRLCELLGQDENYSHIPTLK
jgi:hypothetical protein